MYLGMYIQSALSRFWRHRSHFLMWGRTYGKEGQTVWGYAYFVWLEASCAYKNPFLPHRKLTITTRTTSRSQAGPPGPPTESPEYDKLSFLFHHNTLLLCTKVGM